MFTHFLWERIMLSKMQARYKELLDETRTSDDPWKSEIPLSDCVKETAKVARIVASIALTVASKFSDPNNDGLNDNDGYRDGHSGYGYYFGDQKVDDAYDYDDE